MSKCALSLRELTMSFKAGKPVLDDIDFVLEAGTVTGLLGRNGSGKTTLMRVALGLLKPVDGKAMVLGSPSWDAPAKVRQQIGYVPQSSVPFSWLRVSDCLTLVGSFYENWDEQLVKKYLHEWDVNPVEYIHNLSTGQQQKVAILMAIGHRPDLLILDEPVASLDPMARRQFLQALVELNNDDLDRTILFSTHITSDLERVAADVAILHGGKVRYRGELDNLKENFLRLHLSGTTLPENLLSYGVINYQQTGNRATAFAPGWCHERTLALQNDLEVSIEAESLPLDELFMELTHD